MMARPEHIPWSHFRCGYPAFADERFALLSHRDVGSHHRGRLRHADTDDMANISRLRGCDRYLHRNKIDLSDNDDGGEGVERATALSAYTSATLSFLPAR